MEETPLKLPVTDIELVLRVCDAGEPLEPGDSRYVDFSDLRQGVGIFTLQQDLLTPLVQGHFHHRCLCGHRGSGKSTELLSLKQWADNEGFLTVRTEVDEHFGLTELEFSDLFLLTATIVEDAMAKFGHPLPKQKILQVIEWFADVIKVDQDTVKSEISTEAGLQLGAQVPVLAKLFAKFTAGVKADTQHATIVRRQVRNNPHTLLDLTNDLLQSANKTLAQQGKPRGLLLLFDNLDRYEPMRIDRVLFQSSELVRRLACHAVFTIPIGLEYDPPSGPTQDHYGFSIVLPMLSLRRKTDMWGTSVAESAFDAGAIAGVRQALDQRIDVKALFENPEDADLLIKMSGGCIRDLMHLVTLAFTHARGANRFTSDAVQKSIRQMRATYIRRLTAADYEHLTAIARRQFVGRDEETNRLLFHRFALEYLDEKDVPWMDVHPLVIETEEFRHVFDSHSPLAQP